MSHHPLSPTMTRRGILGVAALSLAAAALLLRHASEPQRLRPAIALSVAAPLVHALALAAGLAASAH